MRRLRGFLFAAKASRYLTHVRRLRDVGAGIGRYYERIQPLLDAGKLGPIVWQLPATFRRDDAVLEQLLWVLPAGRHCFEFRHESWFEPQVIRAPARSRRGARDRRPPEVAVPDA